jgi:hypothetical protein
MTIAPARTGNDVNKRMAVTKMAQTNNGILSKKNFFIVYIKNCENKIDSPYERDGRALARDDKVSILAILLDAADLLGSGSLARREDEESPRVTRATILHVRKRAMKI